MPKQSQTIPYLLILTVLVGTLLLIVLLSCPPIITCYCHMRRKMKQLTIVQQCQQGLSRPPSQNATASLQPPEYEDIQELQATMTTRSPSAGPDLAAAYTFTRCPAYQVPRDTGEDFPVPIRTSSQLQYPDIQEGLHGTVSAHPSSFGVTACYSMIQCPAYGQIPPDTGIVLAPSPPLPPRTSPCMSHDDVMNPRAHEYEDIEDLASIQEC